ncbi:conserved hypothetical protein; putative exported protein [Herminiimonas arsenicoxydans]|uniref:DUF2726 domain-containing protein n=1 Tax=Herminiimonas arsenicoxydans TaxID=204773 RepID=A4G5I4_HERAR|nr:conserved hypothetical protein; putative exported protein [Herminiimonas arsenicoxydans]
MIWTFAVLGLALIVAVLAAREGTKSNRKLGGTISQKSPLSAHEQALYFRLLEALPDHIVLTQVAFSALMTADKRATRNAFGGKVANFVICEKSFKVVAIVEVDVASYKGKEAADARHDMILQRAGYKSLRYKSIPEIRKIKADIAGLAQNADLSADPV